MTWIIIGAVILFILIILCIAFGTGNVLSAIFFILTLGGDSDSDGGGFGGGDFGGGGSSGDF
jgi:hypothetical protein